MLTATAIKAARPRTKPYKLFDQQGLFLLVNPSGSRLWRYKYRYEGREKLLALGPYELVSLAEAREKRDAARKLLLEDKDPGAVRAQLRTAAGFTFKEVATEWLGKQTMAAATLAKAHWLFNTWLFPSLGADPIANIAATDLLAACRRAETTGAHETAHRMRARAGQVFRYAIATGRAERDVSADLRGALTAVVVKNHAAITDVRQVGELLRAIDGYAGQPSVHFALRIAPHVFVRPGELRAAEWSEFDIANKTWRIPADRVKTRMEHIVPLSKQVLQLLAELRPFTGHGNYLFPALTNRKRCISENTLNAALRRLGYDTQTDMTAHGFRALASTLLNEQGVTSDLIELQLAHKEPNKVRAAYNRAERLPERRKLMQQWSNRLDELRAATA